MPPITSTTRQRSQHLPSSTSKVANTPIYLLTAANEKGRQAYLHHDRQQSILISGLQSTCQDTNQTIGFFPNGTSPKQNRTPIGILPHPPARFQEIDYPPRPQYSQANKKTHIQHTHLPLQSRDTQTIQHPQKHHGPPVPHSNNLDITHSHKLSSLC